MNNIHNSNELPDFSLVLGGPLFQLLVRSRLATPALELLKRRIVFISGGVFQCRGFMQNGHMATGTTGCRRSWQGVEHALPLYGPLKP